MLAALSAPAETIRGSLVGVIEVEGEQTSPAEVEFRPEGVVGVRLAPGLRFVEGVQFELTIPQAAREVPGGLGLYIYTAPGATLDSDALTREGRQLFFLPLPARNRVLVKVPFAEDHEFRRTADVYVASPAGEDGLPLLAQIVPVMKGLPGRAATARFSMSAKPLIRNIGGVRLFLLLPDGGLVENLSEEGLEVTLDSEPVEQIGREVTLLPGLHRVAVRSERFENESLTFGVERGRVAELRIELQRPRSTIRIDAPETAELFVDGERIGEGTRSFTLPAGEHTVLFRIGDYSVSQKLTIEPKQDYEISLSLDILISED
ncbi:MAG: hypothetical protein GVY29_04930 [Spirochaetes bacterium]|nr:hypothetical protein [Spirochaetota bacterium]